MMIHVVSVPQFNVPSASNLLPWQLLLLPFFGLLLGCVGALYVTVLNGLKKVVAKLTTRRTMWLLPFVAGAATGVIGIFFPKR